MSYSQATWRIEIAKGMFVEVSVKGLDHDRQSCSADDVLLVGSVLKDVGRAMRAIVRRWELNATRRVKPPSALVGLREDG